MRRRHQRESTTFNNDEEDDIELKSYNWNRFLWLHRRYQRGCCLCGIKFSSSLQEELKNIDTITQKYTLLAESAQTQGDECGTNGFMWFGIRNWIIFGADSVAWQIRILRNGSWEEQRNWIAMKEEVTLMSLGSQEEKWQYVSYACKFPLGRKNQEQGLFHCKWAGTDWGESFAMPEASTKYGLFVDNQGTDAVYSSLITQQSWEGEGWGDHFCL